jgi:poly(A)-specific ribonuclease
VVDHEAGYDSLLTATIMIRLSAKLEAKGVHIDSDSSGASYSTAPEDLLNKSNYTDQQQPPLESPQSAANEIKEPSSNDMQQHEHDNGGLGFAQPQVVAQKSRRNKRKRVKSSSARKAAPTSVATARYAHTTIFDQLRDLSLHSADDETQTAEETAKAPESKRPTWDAPIEPKAQELYLADPIQRGPMQLMPPFGTQFWRVYGNKLRVFGTVESVLKLDE